MKARQKPNRVMYLFQNTESEEKGADPFVEHGKKALLKAVIFYLLHHQKPEYQNFAEAYSILQRVIHQRYPSVTFSV